MTMKHLKRITTERPEVASTGLVTILSQIYNLTFSLVVRQRQSQWKTPFPFPSFDFIDTTNNNTDTNA